MARDDEPAGLVSSSTSSAALFAIARSRRFAAASARRFASSSAVISATSSRSIGGTATRSVFGPSSSRSSRAHVGPTMAAPRGTIRPTASDPPAKRPAVNLSAVTWRTHGKKRAAKGTSGKPEVEHVLACADLLPRSSSRARLHPSTRPRSTWKAGSWRSRPSSYRRLNVVPGGPRPTKFPAAEPLAADHTDRSGQ